jgi:SAM-dependent methyltransferase/predicted kinase/N-acetylglutamate synthase-like GNAT family acetyltransferase
MSLPTIRLASPEDAQAIRAVVLRCLHEVNVKDYGSILTARQAETWTIDRVLGRLRERIMFAAVTGEDVVGVAGFDGKQVRTVFVRPDWHGRGVGASLMRAIEDLAAEMGCSELPLLSSITAQGFYARLGYEPVEDVLDGEERTILMRKPIALAGANSPPTRDGLRVFAMCGIAFAGKSTLARRVAEAMKLDLISLDTINAERGLHGGEGIPDARWEETSFIAMTRLRKCLEQGRGAVVDDTFSHRFLRERCQRVATSCGANFTIVLVDTPISVIQSRRHMNAVEKIREPIRDEVFEHHLARFEYPTQDEPTFRISREQDVDDLIAQASLPKGSRTSGATDYETIATRYAAGIDQRPWNTLYERPTMLALLPDVVARDVLDAGCGPGWYSDQLTRHGARVVAVDRSARMVALAAQRLTGRAKVLQGDVTDLRGILTDSSFDLIVSSLVLHYVKDLPTMFFEWARLLRPQGMLVFSTHHPIHQPSIVEPGYLKPELIEEEWAWLGEKMRYYRRPLRDLIDPLTAAGFVIERICEPSPSDTLKAKDPRGYDRLSRLPAFLFVRARKLPPHFFQGHL